MLYLTLGPKNFKGFFLKLIYQVLSNESMMAVYFLYVSHYTTYYFVLTIKFVKTYSYYGPVSSKVKRYTHTTVGYNVRKIAIYAENPCFFFKCFQIWVYARSRNLRLVLFFPFLAHSADIVTTYMLGYSGICTLVCYMYLHVILPLRTMIYLDLSKNLKSVL